MRWLIRVVAVASIAISIALVVPQIVFRWPEGPYTVFAVSLNASIAVAYVAVGGSSRHAGRGIPSARSSWPSVRCTPWARWPTST